MSIKHEVAFEAEICEYLDAHGWEYSPNDDGYDRERALFPDDVFEWLQATQPDAFAKVTPEKVLDRIAKVASADPVNGGGTLNVLKKGVDVTPAKLRMFQPKPAIGFNEKTAADYTANRLRVMRQVRYSKKNGNELDLVLFVNGIPVTTIELKTDLTQSAAAALKQYANDRPPVGEPLLEFGRGALVHFVVSNELAYMTTRLEGTNTTFLPFNVGRDNGAGNPAREGTSPTAYLWEEILQRDTWLDLLGRFLHYRFEDKTDAITGKKSTTASLRFPRYHQWRAVTKLENAARTEGPGNNYLVQHSAGSGKTDSIAWTAHRLASLHDDTGNKMFDGVIVVSDRTVLDGQLQRAVEQLESTAGVFQPITSGGESAKSKQLIAALQAGKQIIGVTLQTFPFALQELQKEEGALAGRNYAVIADEAHSSQSGDAASALKTALASGTSSASESEEDSEGPETTVDTEDVLADYMAKKAGVGNISFFAFTATPKGKTVELFGRPDPVSGVKAPFDLYPMKQAIEEGFILDVLKNYVSYDLAFTIAHAASADPEKEVDVTKASAELMQWVSLHAHSIAQKVAIIVEHYRRNVQPELGGRGKAMVVTSSRKHAVRYKQEMERYLVDNGLAEDIGVLVAFSGTVTDGVPLVDHTETSINPGLVGRALEDAFKTDAFNVMIVANKFQTGFDQPLLVGMYVDKKLSGITAVQTLSRLNRVIPGKENTYVVDFVNEPGIILEAFQTYYEEAELNQASDPDIIHDMRAKLKAAHIIDEYDIDSVVREWIDGTSHNKLYSHIKASRDVFWDRWRAAETAGDETEKATLVEFRGTVSKYVSAYDFLSQIVNYENTDVEKWAIFLRVYRSVIERESTTAGPTLADDIVLTHYRLKRLGQATLVLNSGGGPGLTGVTSVGSGVPREPKYGPLSSVIKQINDLFVGTGISAVDQVNVVQSVMRHAVENPQLRAQAMANTEADFALSPGIPSEIEDVMYQTGIGHNDALQALLKMADTKGLVKVLLDAGLWQSLRDSALESAAE